MSNDGTVNNVRHLLIQIMRARYPDIAAYQNNELLYEPPVIQDDPPQIAPETPSTDAGLQVDVNLVSDNERIKVNQLLTMEPFTDITNPMAGNFLDDEYLSLVQPQFEFFVTDEPPLPEPEGEPEDGVFITAEDLKTQDPHALYLQNNSGDTPLVFYIDNGTARQINQFKTLEVMLVQRSLTYDDIRPALDADFERFYNSNRSLFPITFKECLKL